MGIQFFHVLEIVWVSALREIFHKPKYLGVDTFEVWEIVWIFASRKIFKKLIIFKCLCFPIVFPYYENSLFPCVRNCMDFCFIQNM